MMDAKSLSLQDGLQPPGPDLPTLPTTRPPRKCPVCKQIEGTTTEDGYEVKFTDGNRRCKVCVVDAQRARRAQKKDAVLAMFDRNGDDWTTQSNAKLTELEAAVRAWAVAHEELKRNLETQLGLLRSGLKDEENDRLRAENAIVLG
jgi:hypothetical protein